MKIQKCLAVALLLMCGSQTSIGEGYCRNHSRMYSSVTPDGPSYLLPKYFPIHPISFGEKARIGDFAGTLRIDALGNASVHLSNPQINSLKILDKKTANKILGEPVGPQGEDEEKPYYWTFEVLAIHAVEKNLYHIDVQFSDADQHWKKYRVRGYQISNKDWISVE